MDSRRTKDEEVRLLQEINENENQLDQLKKEQRQVQKTFDNLQQDIHRGSLELSHLNQELVHFGGSINLMDQDEKVHFYQRKLSAVGDEMNKHYQIKVKKAEERTEKLYQKRRSQTWA